MVDQSRINDFWPAMKGNLLRALPLHQRTEAMAEKILYSLMMGRSQLWVAILHESVYGYFVTTIITDPFTEVRNLLIHVGVSLNGSASSVDLYRAGVYTLKEFCVRNRCKNIIGFTNNVNLLKLIQTVSGADTSLRLFSIPIEGD